MKIAIDGSIFCEQATGIGNYVYNLVSEWARLQPDDQFIIYSPFGLVVSFKEDNIYIPAPLLKQGKRLNRAKKLFWFQIYLPFLLAKDNISFFWAGNGMVPILHIVPILLTVHDFVYKLFPHTMHPISLMHRKIIQPFAIKQAKWIACNSYATNDDMVKFYHRQADIVVYPSADSSFYPRDKLQVQQTLNELILPSEYYFVVGTIEPRKNLELFIECYLEYYKLNKDMSIPLVISGGQGWKNTSIHKIIDEGKKAGVIIALGYVEKELLPILFSGAKAYFMPSIYEGFGMPILEARKCGCPVVCSDVAAMKEAGGNVVTYHKPDRAGIMAVLEKINKPGFEFKTDFGESADWSWKSGAEQLIKIVLAGKECSR